MLEHHEMLRQARAVLIEAPYLDRTAGATAGRQEAMTVGQRPRLDLLHALRGRCRRPPDGERHDAAAVEEQQPPDGAAEDKVFLPVFEPRIPIHLLGELQVAEQRREYVGQGVDRALAT